ncbi:MAG: ABC transporter ATP-binding protein [Rhodanobacter denitrificans]|uniref:ABC transporter ATP-binding protein n=1 Tax=Rhodanobacter denitrificans TaxID=666685 RepID=A0A2W5KN48_9GAMM|nr:MAG: ABC transporter ATP-binding protein [Rhodanobacter denitrificans]
MRSNRADEPPPAAAFDRRDPRRDQPAAALAVQDLRQVYGARIALDGVSWQAAAGETVCLLGHSGCGKTTLLRLIAGLESPTAGRVLLDGEEVSGPQRHLAPERRGIGLVFQDYALFPHLSVLANVQFGLREGSAAARRAIALAALTRVGMQAHAEAFPHTLSGGEQQRVALARALAPQPRLLLMDEPFSNLDGRLRDQVRDDTLAVLREAGTTAVIVTHDPEEALRIADRIVLMRHGRIEQSDTPEALYRAPATLFAARFFCDLNEMPAACRDGAVATPLGRFDAPGFAEGAAVRVCVRPQDLSPSEAPGAVRGRVIERVFLGESEQLAIALDGLAQPLRLRRRAADASLRPGAALTLAAEHVLLYPDLPSPSPR